ncbi:UNVERIFIED_CONTAM: hypothetical protein RMT77_001147 [Armadillidium vulgare]
MKILVFLIFSQIWDLSLETTEDYCKLSALHSVCKSTVFGPSCFGLNPREVIPSEEDKEVILNWHNSIREKVASGEETDAKDGTLPQASNMLKLIWDDELALIGQAWADNCIPDHDDAHNRIVLNDRFPSVGQNIAYLHSTAMTNTSINFISLIDIWYASEVENLSKNLISNFQSTTDGTYGHYTQIIWAETEAVGCGGVLYEDGILTYQLVVCNYGKGGNYLGLPVYKIGTPCSSCSNGTSCEGSLCEKEE